MTREFDVENRLQRPEHWREQHRHHPAHRKAYSQAEKGGDYGSFHSGWHGHLTLNLHNLDGKKSVAEGHRSGHLRRGVSRNPRCFMYIHLHFGGWPFTVLTVWNLSFGRVFNQHEYENTRRRRQKAALRNCL